MNTKATLILIGILIGILNASSHQRPRQNREPVLTEVSALEIVQSVYPEATKLEKINDLWFRISNNRNTLMGFAITSESFSNDIRGFNGPTPVMFVTNRNLVIQKTALLSHFETISYIKRLEAGGFFNGWTNAKFEEAATISPDGWTGATITAEAVNKNISRMVELGIKNRPDRRSGRR